MGGTYIKKLAFGQVFCNFITLSVLTAKWELKIDESRLITDFIGNNNNYLEAKIRTFSLHIAI